MKNKIWALLAVLLALVPCNAFAGFFVSVSVEPPPLVVYEQPEVPGPDYIWTPGYWAYDEDGWYWVPGAWVLAPEPGLLWTPGYWAWDEDDGHYVWRAGYWGPSVGYYGGVVYGYGYTGVGYHGGYWQQGVFWYNRSCSRVNVTVVHNTYNKTVIVNKTSVTNVSYNGGKGGTTAQPIAVELKASKEQHVAPTALQTKQQTLANSNKAMYFNNNKGKPVVAATAKVGEFSGKGVVSAKAVAPNKQFQDTKKIHADDHGALATHGKAHDDHLKTDQLKKHPGFATGGQMQPKTFGNQKPSRFGSHDMQGPPNFAARGQMPPKTFTANQKPPRFGSQNMQKKGPYLAHDAPKKQLMMNGQKQQKGCPQGQVMAGGRCVQAR